jgi:GDP-4-dehydro-6-deoxy-D-mannose reductase
MRVLVTAEGFVGRWLTEALAAAGHAVAAPGRADLDVTVAESVRHALARFEPDAVAHLAAVSFAPDARSDPARALLVNVGGTINLLEAVRGRASPPVVLVTGSSEVYGAPDPSELPLSEESPLAPRTPYALSKAAQEGVSLAYAARYRLRLVATRSFNHSGPGQRPVFVVPALAARIAAVREGREPAIPVGNVDVRRDFTDVRDVARAYRLLLEAAHGGRIERGGAVLNVASGRAIAVREIVDRLCALAGVPARISTDPALVRPDDPPEHHAACERCCGRPADPAAVVVMA